MYRDIQNVCIDKAPGARESGTETERAIPGRKSGYRLSENVRGGRWGGKRERAREHKKGEQNKHACA